MRIYRLGIMLMLAGAVSLGGVAATSTYAAHPNQSYGCKINPKNPKCVTPPKAATANGVVMGVKGSSAPVVQLPKTGGASPAGGLNLVEILFGVSIVGLGAALRRRT